jgi:hypothetical protein
VVDTITRFLKSGGWLIVSKANTHVKERGVDIHATKGGKELLIEVKGFPSKNYRDPRRAGERKPTNPTLQAQQWYSHAPAQGNEAPDKTSQRDYRPRFSGLSEIPRLV